MSGADHDHMEPGDPRVEQVADGVFAYIQPDGSWWINNTGFLVGRDRVFAIDACSTERRTRRFRAAIERVTQAPVRTLLNTHHHGDHTHGNGYFPEATILAHEETRRLTLGQQPPPNGVAWEPVDWGELPPAPPFVTYVDGVDVWVDDRQVLVRHIGTPAHTTNDSIAWLPEERVAGWSDSERIVGNLHRAYLELDGGARGAPLELVNALGDMVTYNGGRPLRCLA